MLDAVHKLLIQALHLEIFGTFLSTTSDYIKRWNLYDDQPPHLLVFVSSSEYFYIKRCYP